MYEKCKCIKEPRGHKGLEGFQRDHLYFYEEFTFYGHGMIRLFPDGCHPLDRQENRYYEICTRKVFNEHFETVNEPETELK